MALGLPLLEAMAPMARSGFAAPRKSDVPMSRVEEFREHARLMVDIMAFAFQTDTTRVATMMLDNAGGNRSYTEVGVKESHHGFSHHRNDPEKVDQLKRIDRHLMEQFAYFLKKNSTAFPTATERITISAATHLFSASQSAPPGHKWNM